MNTTVPCLLHSSFPSGSPHCSYAGCHFLTSLHGFGCESVGKTFALPRSFPDQAKALGVDEEVTKVFSGLLNWMQCITSKDG